jgi:flagellum-specific peptidoglycan hydrolase FlgJ
MPLTPAQRALNLARIARAAVSLERTSEVPAELCSAQCILESGWLEKSPGNNPFGIKAKAGEASTPVLTTEFVTPVQLNRLRAQGKQIQTVGPLAAGKHRITLIDHFAAYVTLEDAFFAYGRLLTEGRFFKNRFARYRTHRSLPLLLADMKGGDGDPPYATDPNYDTKILQLSGQSNVRAALAAARSSTE